MKMSMYWCKGILFLKEYFCEIDFFNSRVRWRDGGYFCVVVCIF